MRMAGRFSRRLQGYAKAEGIPLVHCQAGERKHELAEEYLAKTQNNPWLQTPPENSLAQKELSPMGSSGRETCV
jgi:hypothetical protein